MPYTAVHICDFLSGLKTGASCFIDPILVSPQALPLSPRVIRSLPQLIGTFSLISFYGIVLYL